MATVSQIPTYTAYLISGSKKYNVTPALISVDRSEPKGQIAQRVTLHLMNIQVDGVWLSSIPKAGNRVYLYANDGSKNVEVFRGFLWTRNYTSSLTDHELKLVAYDHLIYLQESEDSYYFAARRSTEDIVSEICKDWGIKLEYSYNSISNPKLPVRGNLYDILTADILDETQKRTGMKYVVLSDKDTMIVRPAGANTTIYQFISEKNVVKTSSGWTMEGVITQVIILGKADDNDQEPIEAAIHGKTSEYGTLQKIMSRGNDTELWEARVDAENTIRENGEPKWEYEITAPDIPWIRKGDMVYVDAGDIVGENLIVTAVNRSCDAKTSIMTMTLEYNTVQTYSDSIYGNSVLNG